MTRTPEELLALACRFHIGADIYVERRGPDSWAVCTASRCCINTDFERELEPFPSSRSESFLARTRFASLDEAVSHAEAYLQFAKEEMRRHSTDLAETETSQEA
ncbi:hypothetical protein AB9K35_17970 [Leisingera sp. XS_AS12]|uniref:hypothetical protein n=1 Tax=Leisingera TaxID=191028 RepID=UPI0003FEB598|nr:hypothetical protein [Leisingera caerulea]